MISAGLKLDVYFGESLNSGRRMANEALMDCFAEHSLEVAALYREYGATEKPNPMTLWADMYRFHEAGLCNCHRHAKLKGLVAE